MLQWAAEEKVLLEIHKVIADAWRMNSRQLSSYCKNLRIMQPEMMPGCIGSGFLDILDEIREMEKEERIKIWPRMLQDTDRLLEMIREHQSLDEKCWQNALIKLEAQPGRYFKTALGSVFTLALREKLGVRSIEQKAGCPAENQSELEVQGILSEQRGQKILSEQRELEIVASWLMEEKEKKKPGKKKKSLRDFLKLPDEAVIAGLACASFCLLAVWLYGQAQRNQSFWNVQRMKATAAAQQEDAGLHGEDNTAQPDGAGLYGAEGNAAQQENSGLHVTDKNTARQSNNGQQGTGNKGADNSKNVKRPTILTQYKDIAKEYPGLFGWLQIPDTQINLPVMRPLKENDFYLHHDFAGAESTEGALFVDPLSSRWPQDENTVVYGHNMKNGHMFGILDLYTDEDYFQAHKKIHFDTIYETGVYEAVAVVKTRILNENEQGFRYYQFFEYDSKEEFRQCAAFVRENQLFDSGSMLEYGDKILMLSTCEYSQENGRLLVIARRRT